MRGEIDKISSRFYFYINSRIRVDVVLSTLYTVYVDIHSKHRLHTVERVVLMKNWKDAWILFKRDLYIDRMYLIWNVLFMIYTGVMLSFLFRSIDTDTERFLSPVSDFMMLLMIPITGFYFSRRSFNYIKEDSYTQMLKFYRTLPIPITTVVKSRLIQMITAFIFNGIIFYPILYLSAPLIRSELSVSQYLAFILTWMGGAILLNSIFIYFEFLKSGRTYMWITMALIFSVALMAFVLNLFDMNLVGITMDYSVRYALLSPVMWGMLVLGIFFLYMMSLTIAKKLTYRNLA